MIFKALENMWVFSLIPLGILISLILSLLKQRQLSKFIQPAAKSRVVFGLSKPVKIWQYILFYLALLFFCIAFMKPQLGFTFESVVRRGQDIMIAVDISKSMLARDIAPSRLGYTKREVLGLIDQLKGDRVGLIVFSGQSYIQCPLTTDYGAIKLFLEHIEVGQVPQPGTNIAAAIYQARVALRGKNKKMKSLIIFSDGEAFDGDPSKELEALTKQNISLYAVGVGSSTGEPIPELDEKGQLLGYKRDQQNKIILSKLNEPLLKGLLTPEGAYYSAKAGQSIADALYKNLNEKEVQNIDKTVVKKGRDRYQWFLFLSFLCLAGASLLQVKPKAVKGGHVLFLIALFFMGSAQSIEAVGYSTYKANQSGIKYYQEGDIDHALKAYAQGLESGEAIDVLHHNLGHVFKKNKDLNQAKLAYEKALSSPEKLVKASAHYHLGNVAYERGHIQDAIDHYQQALLLNPQDPNAKHNLEVSLLNDRQKNEKEGEDQDENDSQDQQDKDKNKDKDNQDQKNKENKNNPDNNDQDENEPQDDSQDNPQPAPENAGSEKREDISRILAALEQKEREAKKEYLKRLLPTRVPVAKDW